MVSALSRKMAFSVRIINWNFSQRYKTKKAGFHNLPVIFKQIKIVLLVEGLFVSFLELFPVPAKVAEIIELFL